MKTNIVEILIERGNTLLNTPYKVIEFTKDKEADKYLNNLNDYPHAYVLACIMDRQIQAERAWVIPFKISQHIGSKQFETLLQYNINDYKSIFTNLSLHRFNEMMAENYYYGVQKIQNDYKGKASNIWIDKPKSATIVKRFLQFKGIGIKIATMATNILAREFKTPMQDHICIDISPDVQVRRVFHRIGLLNKDASNDELIFTARELNTQYPGIFDLCCWEIGRKWCSPRNPKCNDCYLNDVCPKENI